jgi:hypothetical protein
VDGVYGRHSYIFKPRGPQADADARAAKGLRRMPGLGDLKLSHFYEFAVEVGLREYQQRPVEFGRALKEYFQERSDGDVDER